MNVRGFSLPELLVALALGLVLATAALALYARALADRQTSNAVLELAEAARHAAELLERELRGAGYLGLAPDAALVVGRQPAGRAPPPALAVAGCGPGLPLDLESPVTAADARFALDAATPLDCAPSPGGRWQPGSDTLTVRRAGFEPAVAERGRLQLATTRSAAALFADGRPPLPAGRVHDLETAVYYVSADATQRPGLPSLRRKRLVGGPAGPRFQDEELVAGVEDLQVEFGVDGPDADEWPEAWVAPGEVPADATVRSVRVWLRVRSERPEAGFREPREFDYAGERRTAPGDGHRRVLVARTVHLRNARRH